MARDRIGRFRSITLETDIKTEKLATDRLRKGIAEIIKDENLEELSYQGDEPNEPFDLFQARAGADINRLHPFYRVLSQDSGRAPARAVFREIGPWLAPSDPHFVKEFQEKAFDQRLWELYLWASFRELGYNVDQPEAPDFLCIGPGIQFTVEATTSGPSKDGVLAEHPNPQTEDEIKDFLENYMPMKFGSCLTKKLNYEEKRKGLRYWERGKAPNKPFLIAVADFHKPGDNQEIGSMTYTHSALWPYLYGHRIAWEFVDGELRVQAVKGAPHTYKNKVVETGFFDLPGTENISGILFSNAGTLAKFDRMGLVAGFSNPGHKYYRIGIRYNPEPNAIHGTPFVVDIEDEKYDEYWTDELQLFHNPNAKHPINPDTFGGITQHFFKDGDHYSATPEGGVIASRTVIMKFVGDQEKDKQVI